MAPQVSAPSPRHSRCVLSVCLCCALGRRTSALSLQPTWDYLLPAACCLRRSKWTWRSYDVQEGGTASYCSSDPLSRNNCVQGYSG